MFEHVARGPIELRLTQHQHAWTNWEPRIVSEIGSRGTFDRHIQRRQCLTCPDIQEVTVDAEEVEPATRDGVWVSVADTIHETGIAAHATEVDALRDALECNGNAFFLPVGSTLHDVIAEWYTRAR